MNEFNQSLFGGYTLGQFAGLLFWALIGAYILLQYDAQTRDVQDLKTPTNFSWKFWLNDNWRRIVFNLVLIMTCIRFSKEVTGMDINEFTALVIGLSSDVLAQLLSKFKIVNLKGTAKK